MRGITAVAGIGIAAGLIMPGVPASARAAAPAAASASANLYVNSEADSGCSYGGSGTANQPFCTIAAAAAIVQPECAGAGTGTVPFPRNGSGPEAAGRRQPAEAAGAGMTRIHLMDR